jgi:hypothetical protein
MTTSPNASKKVPQPVAGEYSGGNIDAFSVVFDGIVEFCGGGVGVVVLMVVEVVDRMSDELVGRVVGATVDTTVEATVDTVSFEEELVLIVTGVVETDEEFPGTSVTGAIEGLTVELVIKRFKANEFRTIFPLLSILPLVPFAIGSNLLSF